MHWFWSSWGWGWLPPIGDRLPLRSAWGDQAACASPRHRNLQVIPLLQANNPQAALQKGLHLLLQVGGEQALSVPSLHHGVAGPGGQDSWPWLSSAWHWTRPLAHRVAFLPSLTWQKTFPRANTEGGEREDGLRIGRTRWRRRVGELKLYRALLRSARHLWLGDWGKLPLTAH